MPKEAQIINFEENTLTGKKKERKIKLPEGRKLVIRQEETGEIISLLADGGEVIIQISMTKAGPVVSVNCGTLELNASENITLAAKNVEIAAREAAVLRSKGTLEIESVKEMGVKSDDDIIFNGKMIHLN